MTKSVKVFAAVLLGIACCVHGFCQDSGSTKETKSLTGTAIAIDWVASLLTIRYFDTLKDSYDEITLTVTSDTRILRGTDRIDFSGIEEGDEVVIEYYRDDFSGLKARSIVDENLANK
jgi:hypothetical protein